MINLTGALVCLPLWRVLGADSELRARVDDDLGEPPCVVGVDTGIVDRTGVVGVDTGLVDRTGVLGGFGVPGTAKCLLLRRTVP